MQRDEGFAKTQRLLKRADFLRAQKCGCSVRGRHFVVVAHRRGDEEPARLGVVASRKCGGAVERNRGKRWVREWFRRRAVELPAGVDLVVILRLGAAEQGYRAVCAELDEALRGALGKARRAPTRRGGASPGSG